MAASGSGCSSSVPGPSVPSGSSSSAAQSKTGQKTWELSNAILEVSSAEEIYQYDHGAQQAMLAAKPWEKDVHFFKDIKVSALALLKMTMHAR